MPDAKFESGSCSIFGNMTLQISSLKKGMSHLIRLFNPGKWVLLEKSEFYVQNRSFRPIIDPPC